MMEIGARELNGNNMNGFVDIVNQQLTFRATKTKEMGIGAIFYCSKFVLKMIHYKYQHFKN